MDILNGITIVFTGVMSKKRAEIEIEAKQLGAWVDQRVTRRSDWLVTGKRAGKTKMDRATKVGCRLLTEDEYRKEIQARQRARAEAVENSVSPTEEWQPTLGAPEWINKLKTGRSVGF